MNYVDAAVPAASTQGEGDRYRERVGAGVHAVWIDTPIYVAIKRIAIWTPDEVLAVVSIFVVIKKFGKPTAVEGFDRSAVQ